MLSDKYIRERNSNSATPEQTLPFVSVGETELQTSGAMQQALKKFNNEISSTFISSSTKSLPKITKLVSTNLKKKGKKGSESNKHHMPSHSFTNQNSSTATHPSSYKHSHNHSTHHSYIQSSHQSPHAYSRTNTNTNTNQNNQTHTQPNQTPSRIPLFPNTINQINTQKNKNNNNNAVSANQSNNPFSISQIEEVSESRGRDVYSVFKIPKLSPKKNCAKKPNNSILNRDYRRHEMITHANLLSRNLAFAANQPVKTNFNTSVDGNSATPTQTQTRNLPDCNSSQQNYGEDNKKNMDSNLNLKGKFKIDSNLKYLRFNRNRDREMFSNKSMKHSGVSRIPFVKCVKEKAQLNGTQETKENSQNRSISVTKGEQEGKAKSFKDKETNGRNSSCLNASGKKSRSNELQIPKDAFKFMKHHSNQAENNK